MVTNGCMIPSVCGEPDRSEERIPVYPFRPSLLVSLKMSRVSKGHAHTASYSALQKLYLARHECRREICCIVIHTVIFFQCVDQFTLPCVCDLISNLHITISNYSV